MRKNVGKVDKVVRIVLGVLLVGNVFAGLHNPWGWIGVALIVTALIGFCPIYSALKLNTMSWGERLGLK